MDIVRGAAMVLMALDHVRGFVSEARFDPVDLSSTTPGYFATRWITHLVAPAFVLLAGTGAYLYGKRPGRTRNDVTRFLWTRGVWLVLVEFTLVHFGWFLTFTPAYQFAQVIWAIGISMIALAGLLWLGPRTALVAGAAIVLLHNALDPIGPNPSYFVAASDATFWGTLWMAVHDGGTIYWGPATAPIGFINFAYPVLPWIGLMAIGYGTGSLWDLEARRRRQTLVALAAACFALFWILRAINLYGDPNPWSSQDRGTVFTFLSLLNVTKYPPSLQFLLITLSPTFLALATLERTGGFLADRLIAIGRVPFWFYILHLPAAHVLALFIALAQGVDPSALIGVEPWIRGWPTDFGVGLAPVYALSAGLVMALVPACAWFGRVKRRHADKAWLSYL